MGNREALIQGAKTCLMAKGYCRTTARDIATTAGVSMAAIGYHFGSKEALMNDAMRQALDEWGAEVSATMVAGSGLDGDARERFVATWQQAVETLSTPSGRALWVTQFEVLSLGARTPELLRELPKLQVEPRECVASLFGAVYVDTDPETAQLLGSFFQALLLGVVSLWLFDPSKAPSGEDLARAIELVSGRFGSA